MKKITAADTLELSIQERILLVEDIWDTIASEADAVELSDAEKALIDERLEAYPILSLALRGMMFSEE